MTTLPQPPEILSPEFAADPYPAYRVLREHYPVFHDPGTDSFLLSRYEDVSRAFRDPVFTSDNYEWQLEPAHGGRTLPQMSGREHSVRRALMAPAFRGRELREKFVPVIERNARELIDTFRDAAETDLVARFATRFPINVIVDMLGLDRADHDRFHGWYGAVVGFLANLAQDPEAAEAGRRAGRELADYLLPVIHERRAAPGDDLLSTLCTAEVEGTRMNDQDITSFVSLLLSAGGETTDKALAALFRGPARRLRPRPALLRGRTPGQGRGGDRGQSTARCVPRDGLRGRYAARRRGCFHPRAGAAAGAAGAGGRPGPGARGLTNHQEVWYGFRYPAPVSSRRPAGVAVRRGRRRRRAR